MDETKETRDLLKDVLLHVKILSAQSLARDKNTNDLLNSIVITSEIDIDKLLYWYKLIRANEAGNAVNMQDTLFTNETIAIIESIRRLQA